MQSMQRVVCEVEAARDAKGAWVQEVHDGGGRGEGQGKADSWKGRV